MSRRLRSGLVVTGAALAVAAASVIPGASVAQEPLTLQMWHRGNPTPDAIARWNELNPNIQVVPTRIPDAERVQKLAAAVRGGSPPDIVDADIIDGPLFGLTGVFIDITDRVNTLDFKDNLAPGHTDLSQVDGRWYALPYLNGPSMLMWNKDLFEQAGLDPEVGPTNWAEIKDMATKIRALGDDIYGYDIAGACGGCTVYTVSPFIWASGGTILSEFGPEQTTTFASSPQVAEAFLFYKDLWESGVADPADETENGSTWAEGFNGGKVGIWVGYADNTPTAIEAGIDVGMAPIPGKDGDFSTFEGGDILGIPTGAQHPDESWQVMEWLLSPEAQEINASALVPVRLDMQTPEFAAAHPYISIALDATTQGQAPKSIAFNSVFEDPSSPWLQAFQAIVFGGADPATTLAEADEAARALIVETFETIGQ
jgi:multiple sugar transport system substrate-binding protein